MQICTIVISFVCVKGNIHEILRSMTFKNKEKYGQKKNNKKAITQDNIYIDRQFTYIHEVAGISLFT